MRAVLVAAAALTLAGCQTMPRETLVPVSVPCKVDMPKRPVWATSALARDADIFDQVKALLAERRQRMGYERQLEAAIEGCNSAAS